MPGVCATCKHPQVREINHRLKSDRPLTDISRWLDGIGQPVTRQALARHMRDHLGAKPRVGNRPVSGSFLEAVVTDAHEKLAAGELATTLRDGIAAQAELNKQQARSADRDLMAKIALALTGHSLLGAARIVDPEVEALEADYRLLLSPGDTPATVG
jgi:hypothetical protein